MKKILIATRSKGKFPEIVSLLSGTEYEFLNLNDIPSIPNDFEVEEKGETFEGNAIIKAMTFGAITGLSVIADDSGLCVDSLEGRPGVYSARYAKGTDYDRYMKLLDELKNTSTEKRTARFICTLVFYDPKNNFVHIEKGTQDGLILTEPKGNNGFGYDPVFFNIEVGKSVGEMTMEEKNQVSHRGKAFKKMREFLKSY